MVTLPAMATLSCHIRQILSNSSVVGCAGGVGVYTVLLSLIKKGLESQSKVQYPKESVMIG